MPSFLTGTSGLQIDRETREFIVPSFYVAKAVHFDGMTQITNDALVSSDNGTVSFSCWFKVTSGPFQSGVIWASDAANNEANYYTLVSETEGLFQAGVDSANYDHMPYPFDPGGYLISSVDTWHHILVSFDLSISEAAIYLDGAVYIVAPLTNANGAIVIAGSPSGTLPFNGLEFSVGNDGSTPGLTACDIADLWVAPGVSLLNGSGYIPADTIHKFIDPFGHPIFLGADGSAPTGTAPAVFMTGDHTTFGTNAGTGGTFSTTGVLTDADTHP